MDTNGLDVREHFCRSLSNLCEIVPSAIELSHWSKATRKTTRIFFSTKTNNWLFSFHLFVLFVFDDWQGKILSFIETFHSKETISFVVQWELTNKTTKEGSNDRASTSRRLNKSFGRMTKKSRFAWETVCLSCVQVRRFLARCFSSLFSFVKWRWSEVSKTSSSFSDSSIVTLTPMKRYCSSLTNCTRTQVQKSKWTYSCSSKKSFGHVWLFLLIEHAPTSANVDLFEKKSISRLSEQRANESSNLGVVACCALTRPSKPFELEMTFVCWDCFLSESRSVELLLCLSLFYWNSWFHLISIEQLRNRLMASRFAMTSLTIINTFSSLEKKWL